MEFKGRVRAMENIEVTMEDIVKRVKGMSNGKAPGPDGVQGYCFKAFDCLNQPIVLVIQRYIEVGNEPEWMIFGRTVLIQKDPRKRYQRQQL